MQACRIAAAAISVVPVCCRHPAQPAFSRRGYDAVSSTCWLQHKQPRRPPARRRDKAVSVSGKPLPVSTSLSVVSMARLISTPCMSPELSSAQPGTKPSPEALSLSCHSAHLAAPYCYYHSVTVLQPTERVCQLSMNVQHQALLTGAALACRLPAQQA